MGGARVHLAKKAEPVTANSPTPPEQSLYASEEGKLLVASLTARIRELERVVRDHGKRFDTLQTPLFRRIWFRIDGWPGQRDLNGSQAWRPWHRRR